MGPLSALKALLLGTAIGFAAGGVTSWRATQVWYGYTDAQAEIAAAKATISILNGRNKAATQAQVADAQRADLNAEEALLQKGTTDAIVANIKTGSLPLPCDASDGLLALWGEKPRVQNRSGCGEDASELARGATGAAAVLQDKSRPAKD